MQIELRDIVKSFSKEKHRSTILNGVSWSAAGGEIFGILGPNGSGKTTMLRILLDIIPADRGEITVNKGVVDPRSEEFRHMVGYLPEERALYKSLEVREIIIYFATLKGLSLRKAKESSEEMIKMFDLESFKRHKTQALSKGLAQRVQFACTLVHLPQLVILDEPFYGLDPVNTQIMRELLLNLKKEGRLILLCTHQMREVENLCDRVVMINQGKVALAGRTRELQANFSKGVILMDLSSNPEGLPSVARVTSTPFGKKVELNSASDIHQLLAELSASRREVYRIEKAFTPLEDIFVATVREANERPEGS